jgi:hypothetical protein
MFFTYNQIFELEMINMNKKEKNLFFFVYVLSDRMKEKLSKYCKKKITD